MSFASLRVEIGLPMEGPAPPTFEVVKNTGSMRSKSRSSRMRSIKTEPTMPRQPMNPTLFMCVIPGEFVTPDAAVAAMIRGPVSFRGALESFDHRGAHLDRGGHPFALGRDICGAKARGQRGANRLLDALSDIRTGEGVAEHHRHGEDD